MDTRENIAAWLDQKYREWMNQEGERKSQRQFSFYLDVEYSLLVRWMNGKGLPGNENVIKLGNKLGPKIYDLLGWIRPTNKQS